MNPILKSQDNDWKNSMTEENQTITEEKVQFGTVALSESSSNKINIWIDQIKNKKKGIKITRKEFVNWFFEKSSDTLSNSDLNSIIERFYDEEAHLRQLLREVRKARQEGISESSLEFIVRPKKTETKKESDPHISSEPTPGE